MCVARGTVNAGTREGFIVSVKFIIKRLGQHLGNNWYDIAWKELILFIDLELADKQFQMRYTDHETNEIHMFPDNFERAEIDPEPIVGKDLEEAILDSMEEAAKKGTRFFVLDNITFACNDSEKGATAGAFMMKIIRLKKKYHLTIIVTIIVIVIAHTPKRRGYEPITQNDLAGSAKLINFFDTDTILRLVGEYLLGVTKDGDVIFYQVDIKGRIRGGKIMKYNRETGHSIKDPAAKNPINWVHVPMLRKGLLPEGWTMTQCLFGEHLLAQYPDKVVCLVEAEKTAVICAAMMPEFIWLATGGKS